MNDELTIEAMLKFGGSFVKSLARLYQMADEENQRKLREAFGNYFEEYAGLVELERSIEARKRIMKELE